MSWLGLDIGGANIKIADGKGFAQSITFPLWQQPDQLPAALRELLSKAPQADSLAVTMTGELADCFSTKAEGVETILHAVEQVSDGKLTVRVYLCDGRLVAQPVARAEPLLTAASNWHVLATFAQRYCPGKPGLLIDIGSTTTDIIPFGPTDPTTTGLTDPERLAAGELVYTGVQRSPVCAIVSELPWRDAPCRVAQELFATTQDAYLVLDEMPEDSSNLETADGRPATKRFAHARLARLICADSTMFSWEDAKAAASSICEAQIGLLVVAIEQVLEQAKGTPATVVLSGHGEFLARKVLQRIGLQSEVISLTIELGPETSRSACAHALAVLACERCKV